MSLSFDLSIEVSEQYDFTKESLYKIEQNTWVKSQWPLVYFIQNDSIKVAYVGESTNAASRIKNHLANPERCKLDKISIIGSDKFNKSATLDIESYLIQYITAEGTYELQNGNFGHVNHNYYQQDLYKTLFKEVWKKLVEKNFFTKSLAEIENSEIFKYSPYKSLNEDQYNSVLEVLDGLTSRKSNRIFISGSAGTGKTILATYLIKLLTSDIGKYQPDELNENDLREVNYIKEFRDLYPKAKIGLVVAMTSLRESLQAVFRKIPGLKSNMVINPSDTFKCNDKYDLLIVDEAHRLRQYKNIGWRGAFKSNNLKLGLDDNGNELDWIIANSRNQIFFYDSAQSVKPSDVDSSNFIKLLKQTDTLLLTLKSQMRVKGGSNYIQFVDDLLQLKRDETIQYKEEKYELYVFDSFVDLYVELKKKESEFGLCRMVAGYSWPWLSDPKRKPKADLNAIDIEIEGLKFQWNSTDKDWVNSPKAANEIGCIHTTQGYDLNFTAVIFGREVDYNIQDNCIDIDPHFYFDKYGRIGASEIELKEYIINIYKTLMYRGIHGTFIYACNKNLRDYFKKHIETFQKEVPFRILRFDEAKPFVNSVPLVDISAAAGSFGDWQANSSDFQWIELPTNVAVKNNYFVCKVVGESMNKKIPNGSYCLFCKDQGGSRNGKIVLVELFDRQDSESGARFTVKEYCSEKFIDENSWSHQTISLKPLSDDPIYEPIRLLEDEITGVKVVGIFVCVLP